MKSKEKKLSRVSSTHTHTNTQICQTTHNNNIHIHRVCQLVLVLLPLYFCAFQLRSHSIITKIKQMDCCWFWFLLLSLPLAVSKSHKCIRLWYVVRDREIIYRPIYKYTSPDLFGEKDSRQFSFSHARSRLCQHWCLCIRWSVDRAAWARAHTFARDSICTHSLLQATNRLWFLIWWSVVAAFATPVRRCWCVFSFASHVSLVWWHFLCWNV